MDFRKALEPLWHAADAPPTDYASPGPGESARHAVARVACERLRGRWGAELEDVLAGLATDETVTGEHQWRHEWEQKLVARAALLLGMKPIRKRSGTARYKKIVYVMGPASLVRAWVDVVDHFVPLFRDRITEHWTGLASTHFPLSATLTAEEEEVDATLAG